MSKVELLLPQEIKCGLPKNISQQMTNVYVGNGEPSGDEIVSESSKHQEERQLVEKRVCCNVGDGKRDSNNGERNRKQRRRKKRKWRPYCKLSWDERKVVDERDARRANRIRAKMCANGHTLAPYNTTQFLMEDHNLQEPYYHGHLNGHKHRENSSDPSEEFYSSPEDEEEFLQKQFTETYENIHVERLNNMTQSELALDLMNVEDRVEMLQKRLEAAKEERETAKTVGDKVRNDNFQEQVVKLAVFRDEIQKLTRDNEVLRRENNYLRTLQFPNEDDDEDVL